MDFANNNVSYFETCYKYLYAYPTEPLAPCLVEAVIPVLVLKLISDYHTAYVSLSFPPHQKATHCTWSNIASR